MKAMHHAKNILVEFPVFYFSAQGLKEPQLNSDSIIRVDRLL